MTKKATAKETVEFRLVLYMNGPLARRFWGGRAAASPLAYNFHIYQNPKKKRKVLLGGQFIFKGLGKYGPDIKDELEDELEEASKPISLPWNSKRKKGICISNKAYIYQNNDPLFSDVEHEVYWEATIDEIGNCFTPEEQNKYRLGTVQMGLDTYWGLADDKKKKSKKWGALVSELVKFERPVEKDNCPWKVYGGKGEQPFWDDSGMPSIPYINVFVHATTDEWGEFDESAKRKNLNIRDLIDDQIKNNHIHESLVHELLKMIFARDGWWVNFEVPVPIRRGRTISRGRVDFLVKRNRGAADPWTVIEVKLEDNPDAVEELHDYIKGIMRDVEKNEESHFWPLWNGKGCTEPKGVVLCAFPGTETVKEVKDHNYDFDVWTYEYNFKDKKLGIVIRDAKTKSSKAET